MSGTNHRTWQNYRVGHFLTTVQLDPMVASHRLDEHHGLSKLTAQLIDLMDDQRLPTTWAVSDPAHSAATSRILRSSVAHEFAILGDSNWVGETAGRTRFARELARRVTQARSTGVEVQTFVPRVASVEEHIDLVVKQNITAVASTTPENAALAIVTPRALHYGVWELPVTGRVPVARRWFSLGQWAAWRQIKTAARDAAIYHLVVDAPAMCEEGPAAYATLAWLIRRVANLRDRGMVRVETMAGTATRLANVPNLKPQRSILRNVA